ncbi:MAG: hypothetical protein F6J89_18370 [Symploca sp. SIO1C4]|uniref:Uncharacterized protein n=1 Tax=Symploca sp. SIO1C4 TaxID=2607765 RepID=A0A6B3NIQ0_9CYAN|nr:hypothetical protein [Symploca sp. SIO1C4]
MTQPNSNEQENKEEVVIEQFALGLSIKVVSDFLKPTAKLLGDKLTSKVKQTFFPEDVLQEEREQERQ